MRRKIDQNRVWGLPDVRVTVTFDGGSPGLKGLGEILTEKIFEQIPFIEPQDSPKDEVPALRLERSFLGMNVLIYGYDEQEYLSLEMTTSYSMVSRARELGKKRRSLDLGDHVALLICERVPELKAKNATIYFEPIEPE